MHNTPWHPNAPQPAVTQANKPRAAPILQLSGVRFSLPERVLFENWSVDIAAGLTLVRGAEGSGKTTMLGHACGRCASRCRGNDPQGRFLGDGP